MEAGQRVLDWLLAQDQPSVRYHTLVHLMDSSASDPDVVEARSDIPKRGWAAEILSKERADGHWEPNERFLYLPKYTATNWRMLVLSDLGLSGQEPELKRGLDLYVDEWLMNDDFLAKEKEVCILGNYARALTRFGMYDHPRVRRTFDTLIEDQREDGGWHCDPPPAKGTLDAWEALSAFAAVPRARWTKKMKSSVERGVEFFLDRRLFRQGRRYEPWFRFHYPHHYYYDVLVGLDMVTALGFARDRRLIPALRLMAEKRRPDGTWCLDAIHRDIGPGAGYWPKTTEIKFALEKKGEPSKWVTLTCLSVLKRIEEAS